MSISNFKGLPIEDLIVGPLTGVAGQALNDIGNTFLRFVEDLANVNQEK